MIDNKMHVFVFSDHVSIEDEVLLKRTAAENNLLFMGPEAGTSIIGGVVLGFGNRVRRGSVGIIGASGTGIQQSSTLLHQCGEGISHAIGVGGRDLKKQVGGLMTMQAISDFEQDAGTSSILVVSKPVDKEMKEEVIAAILKKSRKNYVMCFIGDKEKRADTERIKFAKSIQTAVLNTLMSQESSLYRKSLKRFTKEAHDTMTFATALSNSLPSKQRYVRGLFAGGTLCYEAKVILELMLGPVFSNLSDEPKYHIDGNAASEEHTLIDFGDEEFTSARPHPIIDPSLRISRLLEEASDPSTGVIVMDLIMGYNVAEKTVEQYAAAIRSAINIAGKKNRTLPIFLYVCGTEQDISDSELSVLREAGAHIFSSNALMSFAAGMALKKTPRLKVQTIASDYLGVDV
jgi:succinyl-CoA synthetase alpha subunit